MKFCRYCNIEKPEEDFYIKYMPTLKNMCQECYRLKTLERQRQSYHRLKVKRLEYQKQYDTVNAEIKKEYQKTYRLNNKEKIKSNRMKKAENGEQTPIGLVPKLIVDERRVKEIREASIRYFNAGIEIPVEWIKEYNNLIKSGVKMQLNTNLQ